MQRDEGTTEDAAQVWGRKSETVRRGYCVNGHFLGVKPEKLQNGRLVWPMDEVRAAVERERSK